MELISNCSSQGTTVHIEVPLWRKRSPPAITAEHVGGTPDPIAMQVECLGTPRNVYLLGFFEEGCTKGQRCAGEALTRSVERLGCKGVRDMSEADIVFVNIRSQSPGELIAALKPYKGRQLVFLFKKEQERQEFDITGFDYELTCLHRPILPSTLRMLLFQPEVFRKDAGVKPPRVLRAETPPVSDRLLESVQRDEQQVALPPATAVPAAEDSSAPGKPFRCNKVPVIVVEDNRIVRRLSRSDKPQAADNTCLYRIEKSLCSISRRWQVDVPYRRALADLHNHDRTYKAKKRSTARKRYECSRSYMNLV